MSHITQERFSDNNRIRKAEISAGFAEAIYNELPRNAKASGIPVISLTGPNVEAHLREYKRILKGRHKTPRKFHIVEQDPKVFSTITDELNNFDTKYIETWSGDFFKLVHKIIHHNTKRIYLDLDMCRTFSMLKKEHNLLDEIYLLSYRLKKLERVWLTLTFCLRREPLATKQQTIIREIQEAWHYGDLQLMNFASYRDGAPMLTILFRSVGDSCGNNNNVVGSFKEMR